MRKCLKDYSMDVVVAAGYFDLTLQQLEVSAPVRLTRDNSSTAKKMINAFICMRRTALRQLLCSIVSLHAFVPDMRSVLSLKVNVASACAHAELYVNVNAACRPEVLRVPLVVTFPLCNSGSTRRCLENFQYTSCFSFK